MLSSPTTASVALRVAVGLLSVALAGAVVGIAVAEPGPVSTIVHAGVRFALAPQFRVAPELRTAPMIEQAFSDGAAAPLQLIVFETAAPSGDAPSAAAQFTPTYAREIAAGLQAKLGLAEIYAVRAGEYDDNRGVFSLSFKAHNASQASVILAQPDESPAWDQVRGAGEDPRVLKCLLRHLLGPARFAARAYLQANAALAAERCGWPRERVERFLDMAGSAVFAPIASSMIALVFFTRSTVVNVLIAGPATRAADVAASATAIWEEASVDAAVRWQLSWFEQLRLLPAVQVERLAGIALGGALAVFLVGWFFAWLIAKGRVPNRLAEGDGDGT